MIKRIICTATCVCLAFCIRAQEEPRPVLQQEFRVSLGIAPILPEISPKWDGLVYDRGPFYEMCPPFPVVQTRYSLKNVHQPAVNLSYAYRFKKWFALEVRASYSGSYEKYYDLYTDRYLLSDKSSYLLFMPIARFHWVNTPMVSLYSSVGAGVTFSWRKNANGTEGSWYRRVFPAVHFSPIGISVGRRLFGFAEFGASMAGVFQVGMGYKFNKNTP